MPTLILTPRFTEDSQLLWKAAIQLGWDIERLTNWNIPDSLLTLKDPIFYLEGLMAQALAYKFGIEFVEIPENWLENIPFKYSKRIIKLLPLKEVKNIKTKIFVKPPNDKSFEAKIYNDGELPKFLNDEVNVLVSEIVSFEKEFRCFILNRELLTYSIYMRNGILQKDNNFKSNLDENYEVENFVKEILLDKNVVLPISTVIDVGYIKDKGWAIVEQNAIWGSGIYGCDPIEVLKCLQYGVLVKS
jgi:hypothetical protein